MTEKLSHTLFEFGRIPIKVHFSYYIFTAVLILCSFFFASSVKALLVVSIIVSTFCAVLFHEIGHSLTAHFLKHKVQDIVIFPVGGIATIFLNRERHDDVIKIAFAGPATNLVIAGILLMIPYQWSYQAMYINLVLGIGNLLPVRSFDGGHILHALVAKRLGFERADQILEKVTLLSVAVAVFGGLYFSSWLLFFVGLFIFVYGIATEDSEAEKLYDSKN